jgi:hypothetical protein
MKASRIIILSSIAVLCLIILLPPALHGYIYPNIGDDSGMHLQYIQSLQQGEDTSQFYYYFGQALIGYPIVWINQLTQIPVTDLFSWFNYLVLILVGLANYLLVSKLADWKAGIVAMFLMVFGVHTILNLFQSGTIFDLITVGVIVPLLLYCVICKRWMLIVAGILVVLAVIVHSTGISLISGLGRGGIILEPSPSLGEFLSVMLGYVPALIGVACIVYLIVKRKELKIDTNHKIVFISIGLMMVGLIVLASTSFTIAPFRFAVDLSVIVGMLIAILIGMSIKIDKSQLFTVCISGLVIVSSIPIIYSYSQYNSAIKLVDKQAIEYINGLDGDYYSCSPEVAPWIYGRYLNKEYKQGEYPYIKRSEPMSPRTQTDNLYYWVKDWKIEFNPPLDKAVRFSDGEVIIDVVIR